MRLFSWNVNGIRSAAKQGFLKWLSDEAPDALCLQETKCLTEDLDEPLITPFGYKSYWSTAEKKGYSGVAVYSRLEPRNVTPGLGIAKFDKEGRTLIVEYDHFALFNCYFPNSRRDHSRLGYKLEYCDAIIKACDKFTNAGKGVVLCGDLNIAHKEIDLKNPKTNVKNAGFLPEERQWMDIFVSRGYIDSFREFCKEPEQYTWWSNRPGVRAKNIGWRLDYFVVNKIARPKLRKASIHPEVRGSDHCPVSIELDVT
jgi:exodeoxyribonuclease III